MSLITSGFLSRIAVKSFAFYISHWNCDNFNMWQICLLILMAFLPVWGYFMLKVWKLRMLHVYIDIFVWFGLVSLFWWHINLRGLFYAQTILVEKCLLYNLTYIWGISGFLPFPDGISPKANIIARLKFEHSEYNVAVLHVNHNARNISFMFFYCFLSFLLT